MVGIGLIVDKNLAAMAEELHGLETKDRIPRGRAAPLEARGSAHRAQGMEPSTSGALEVRGLRLEAKKQHRA